jgi:hypothetical protein
MPFAHATYLSALRRSVWRGGSDEPRGPYGLSGPDTLTVDQQLVVGAAPALPGNHLGTTRPTRGQSPSTSGLMLNECLKLCSCIEVHSTVLGVKGSRVQILSSRRVVGRYPSGGGALTCIDASTRSGPRKWGQGSAPRLRRRRALFEAVEVGSGQLPPSRSCEPALRARSTWSRGQPPLLS